MRIEDLKIGELYINAFSRHVWIEGAIKLKVIEAGDILLFFRAKKIIYNNRKELIYMFLSGDGQKLWLEACEIDPLKRVL